MTLYPNCKINIGLAIVRKREDGYHDLDTIFYPVHGLNDVLEVREADEFEFVQDGIAVGCDSEDNLVVRAYRLLKALYPDKVGPVRVHLTKRIPFGAGLGGGSSDATFMVRALNDMFMLEMTQQQVAQTVSHLGADCAFFAYNVPCHATGIGDVLTPIEYRRFDGYRLVLVKPNIPVSTKEAYSGVVPREARGAEITPDETPVNDFETSVFAAHPELADIKRELIEAGAEYAAMSGSGSTIYGFFPPKKTPVFSRRVDKCVIYNDVV